MHFSATLRFWQWLHGHSRLHWRSYQSDELTIAHAKRDFIWQATVTNLLLPPLAFSAGLAVVMSRLHGAGGSTIHGDP